MQTLALSRSQLTEMIKILLLLNLGIFLIWNQNLHAAGAPARPSQSPGDIGSTANVYFEAGEKLQQTGDYQRASKKYERAVRIDLNMLKPGATWDTPTANSAILRMP
jgi:hypothetical protein